MPSKGASSGRCPATDGRDALLERIAELETALTAAREERAHLARLTAVASQTPNAILITDGEIRIQWVNHCFTAMTGYSLDDARGRNPGEFLFGRSTNRTTIELTREAISARQPFCAEIVNYSKEGRPFWVEIRAKPLFEEEGAFSGYMAVGTDITERKQTEMVASLFQTISLAVSEAGDLTAALEVVLRKICDATGWSVGQAWLPNPAGTHLLCSEAWFTRVDGVDAFRNASLSRMFRSGKGLPGRTWADRKNHWIRDVTLDPNFQRGPDAHAAGLTVGMGIPIIGDNKTIAVIEFFAREQRDEDESLLALVASVAAELGNVILRKQAEETARHRSNELSVLNAALAKAARLKDEFLANMSHELRTPLTGVLSVSEALQEGAYGSLSDRQRKAVRIIEASGRHLLDLINDILDLSKVEAGQMALSLEPCEVDGICKASLRMIHEVAQHKRHRLSYTIEPPLLVMRVDPRRLKQILVNLVSNAVKFTPEGGQIGLEVHGDPGMGNVRFSVSDTGIGIAHEDVGHLFKPFVQLDSGLSRQYAGTGLGLSLVRRFAELHGGSLTVESELGRGSRFTVALPWTDADASAFDSGRPSSQGLFRNALTFDEGRIDGEHATRHLSKLGISNTVVSDVDDIAEVVAARGPDLVLLHVHQGGSYRWEELHSLKADVRTRRVPIVVVSVDDVRAQAMSFGADGCLVKPYTVDDLQAELSRVTTDVSAPVTPLTQRPPGALILIADDNEQNIMTMADYLKIKRFRVAAARSGREAVRLVEEMSPDLILMDVQMPDMNGFEAMRRIRQSRDLSVAQKPIIAVTALAMPGDRERCVAAGADDYLTKPLSLRDLVATIQAKLATARPITLYP